MIICLYKVAENICSAIREETQNDNSENERLGPSAYYLKHCGTKALILDVYACNAETVLLAKAVFGFFWCIICFVL